jgi:hypothetical protein
MNVRLAGQDLRHADFNIIMIAGDRDPATRTLGEVGSNANDVVGAVIRNLKGHTA